MHRVYCFFFNDTATTEIYTLSLHDALPILHAHARDVQGQQPGPLDLLDLAERGEKARTVGAHPARLAQDAELQGEPEHLRSEEHTSELQSRQYLVCRLLLEKKKIQHPYAVN